MVLLLNNVLAVFVPIAGISGDALLSGAIPTVIVAFGATIVSFFRSRKKKRDDSKTAEHNADAQIEQRLSSIEVRQRRTDDWLLGTQDVFGNPRHNGFATTFPKWQEKIDKSLEEITKLIKNGNGH
jgi:hypothetical protein